MLRVLALLWWAAGVLDRPWLWRCLGWVLDAKNRWGLGPREYQA